MRALLNRIPQSYLNLAVAFALGAFVALAVIAIFYGPLGSQEIVSPLQRGY
mgnify:CR=1 FL=1